MSAFNQEPTGKSGSPNKAANNQPDSNSVVSKLAKLQAGGEKRKPENCEDDSSESTPMRRKSRRARTKKAEQSDSEFELSAGDLGEDLDYEAFAPPQFSEAPARKKINTMRASGIATASKNKSATAAKPTAKPRPSAPVKQDRVDDERVD